MDDYIAVYIYDVKRAIEEVESYFVDYLCVTKSLKRTIYAEALLREKRR